MYVLPELQAYILRVSEHTVTLLRLVALLGMSMAMALLLYILASSTGTYMADRAPVPQIGPPYRTTLHEHIRQTHKGARNGKPR